MSSFDLVIVGGGPAGLATAAAFARAAPHLAHSAVVLERERYPRDKFCAGAIGGRGDRLLEELGVRPDVPSVRIDGIAMRTAAGERTSALGGIGRVVRRIEFDEALARAVRGLGVRVIEDTSVDGVQTTDGGALVRTRTGDLRARLVVGADGVGSVVRRALGFPAGSMRAQVIEVDTEPVDGDGERGIIRFDTRDRGYTGYAWDFPTLVGGRELVCRGIYRLRCGGERTDIHALLDARLRSLGIDPASCRVKRFAQRGLDLDAPLCAGPVLLAGEAAGVDPVTGEGIAQAIEYGVIAGRFAAEVLCDGGDPSRYAARVRRSRLGRDLAVRRRLVPAFYGPARPLVEELLVANPRLLDAACRHFAGTTQSTVDLLGLVPRLVGLWVRASRGNFTLAQA